jgi:hypothetical protein
MRRTAILFIVFLIMASVSYAQGKPDGAPFLGQPSPGRVPSIFAPGVISKGNIHSRLVISPDGRSMFWNTFNMDAGSTQILCTRNIDGKWADPQPPPFAKDGNTQAPLFSPDGKKLFFKIQTDKGWATKYVEMTGTGWSAPSDNGILLKCGSSFTRSGKAYFSSEMKTKVWSTGIFSAQLSANGYSDARPLDKSINIPNAIDYTPFVSPDESYLLFSSNRPHTGDKEDMHIVVSFNLGNGAWSTPKRVFEIPGRFPSISPDEKYLFFCGEDCNIYWVDAAVIESLRPTSASPGVKH